ncbi:unnamed protein product, partial [Choristocarpus tenellus]
GKRFQVRIDGVDDLDATSQCEREAGTIREVDLAAGKEFKGYADMDSLPLQNLAVPKEGVADMTQLNYLHEPAILFNLRRRYFQALPYTYTGDIVIACNPYR